MTRITAALVVFVAVGPFLGAEEKNKHALKADPAATELLAEARAARASWRDFPGFTADIEVNHNGRVARGTVDVDPDGKVAVDVKDADLKAWARREIASLAAHRLPASSSVRTPCAFLDEEVLHPQGRAIQVLNDELHSSYRIRDRQILEVNRTMKDFRFTITVLENTLNKEKQQLPASYVVNSWDLKSGALRSSRAHHHTWTRLGPFDLPASLTVVTATAQALESHQLIFSNHKLRPEARPR